MKLHEYIKSHGFKNVKEFYSYIENDITRKSIDNWYKTKPAIFEFVVLGIKQRKIENNTKKCCNCVNNTYNQD